MRLEPAGRGERSRCGRRTFAGGTWSFKMKITFAAFAFLLATAAAACNTVEGVGEDMQAAGAAVEDTAEDAGN